MSFFSSALKVIGIGAAVLTGVGAIAAGAASLGSLVGSTALASISLPISTSVTGAIAAGANAISSVVTPVANAVKATSDAANAINDQIIQPILQPLTSVINGVQTLTQQIHNDLEGGLAGIAQIPQQIANALTGVDATFSRAAIALGATNSAIVETQLNPGLLHAGAQPLKDLGDIIRTTFNVPPNQIGRFDKFKLPGNPVKSEILDKARAYEEELQHPTKVYDSFASLLYYGLYYLSVMSAAATPDIAELEQEMHLVKPSNLLSIGDIIQADFREEITTADALIEAAKGGVSNTRYAILKELAFELPSTSTAAVWLAQGLITQSDYDQIAQDNGSRVANKDLVYQSQFKPPSVNSIIEAEGKSSAATKGFLPSTLNKAPPSQLVDFYQANLLDKRQATLDWVNHWAIPSMNWFIEAYFRGVRSHTDVINAAEAGDIPSELVEDMITVARPRPRSTMFKNMYDKGIIDEAHYQKVLSELGYSGDDAQLLIKLAKAEKPVAVATQYHELKSLSLSTAEGLYAEGAIDDVQYEHILVAHGFSPEAATLQKQYTDIKNTRSQRKLFAEQLVANVAFGAQTIDDALSMLHAEGFTDREVLRYQKQMTTKKAAAVKYPSLSEVGTMFKRGIISENDYRQFLTDQNFAAEWIDDMVSLELSAPAKATKPV